MTNEYDYQELALEKVGANFCKYINPQMPIFGSINRRANINT